MMQKEQTIKPEQDSKVEKNHIYCCPWIENEKRKTKKHRICIILCIIIIIYNPI